MVSVPTPREAVRQLERVERTLRWLVAGFGIFAIVNGIAALVVPSLWDAGWVILVPGFIVLWALLAAALFILRDARLRFARRLGGP